MPTHSEIITRIVDGQPVPNEPDMPTGRFGLVDALEAVRDGFKVIPLAPGSRSPLKGSHAHFDATDDKEQIRAWWTDDPDRNVGAATTGHVVIDFDLDEPECLVSLQRIIDLALDLPPTMTVRTPSGGLHLWYRTTEVNTDLPQIATSRLPIAGHTVSMPKIDTIQGGPYVPIPGTKRRHGSYTYLDPQLPTQAPEWIRGPKPKPRTVVKYQPAQTTGKRVRALLEKVQSAPVGDRNGILNWASFHMGEVVDDGLIGRNTAEAALLEAAEAAGLRQREALLTIKSGLNRGGRP